MDKNNINFISDLNAKGVVGRQFMIDAPFLTDPLSLQPINYLKAPIEIVNLKSLNTISDSNKQLIYNQISSLFMLSHEAYTHYQNEFFQPKILNSTNCNNPILYEQYGLFTKIPIAQYQILGFYSGIYVASVLELEYLLTQFDIITIGRYGNACVKDGIPVICGHYNGNYMSVINDWRPFEWSQHKPDYLQTLKENKQNVNSVIIQSGDYYFIAYIASCAINENTEILTDYGDGYWEREQKIFLQ